MTNSSTMHNNTTTITLEPMNPSTPISEFVILSKIGAISFAEMNPANPIIFGPPSDEGAQHQADDMLQDLKTDPSMTVTKAIVDGKIVGWSQWHFYKDGDTKPVVKERKAPPASQCPEAFHEFFGQMAEIREKFGVGVGWAVLQVLVVHPDYQGKGVGTALLHEGLQKSDAMGLPAWLEASERGYPLYKKLGWKEVDAFMIDLSTWGKVGQFGCRCMSRERGVAR